MRFPFMFTRYKGTIPANGKGIGSDAVPTTSPPTGQDNVLSHLTANVNGWPTQRIAMVCKYTGAGTPSFIAVQAYFWETRTERWYAFGVPVNVMPNGSIAFFDTIGPIEYIGPAQGADMVRPGNEILMFVATDTGGLNPNGQFDFAAAPDLTGSGG